MGLTFAEFLDTPLGPISFIAGDQGLRCTSFHNLSTLKQQNPHTEVQPSLIGFETIKSLLRAMVRYLNGDPRQVLELTYSIHYGTLMTYGEIAKQLHKPGAAQSVGRALGSNPMPIIIPCHRVIGADGSLRGYLGGISRKTILLELEGHRIVNDRVVSR